MDNTNSTMIKVSGTVTDKSDDSITIRTDAGTEMEFNFRDQLMIPTSVQDGSRVNIEYSQGGSGMIASKVELAGAGSYGTSDTRNNTNNAYGTGTGTGSADVRANNLSGSDTNSDTYGTGSGSGASTSDNRSTLDNQNTMGSRSGAGTTNYNNTTGSTNSSDNTTGSTSYGSGATSDPYGTGSRLPATASPLPLVGILGAAGLAGAAGLSMIRRRFGR